jgi:hypothetical protein
MQITHDQAHRLIQLNIDALLSWQDKSVLSAHLQDCAECQIYASEIKEVDSILLPLLKRQWSSAPIPLSLDGLPGVNNSKPGGRSFLTTRITALSVVVVALLFSVWQLMLSGAAAPGPVPISVPLIPTPSLPSVRSTSTTIDLKECQMLIYTVQQRDTLEEIANRFSVSKAKLRAANHLNAGTVTAGMELMIPICKSTPTGTFDALTTTFTPILNPTTSTPGG